MRFLLAALIFAISYAQTVCIYDLAACSGKFSIRCVSSTPANGNCFAEVEDCLRTCIQAETSNSYSPPLYVLHEAAGTCADVSIGSGTDNNCRTICTYQPTCNYYTTSTDGHCVTYETCSSFIAGGAASPVIWKKNPECQFGHTWRTIQDYKHCSSRIVRESDDEADYGFTNCQEDCVRNVECNGFVYHNECGFCQLQHMNDTSVPDSSCSETGWNTYQKISKCVIAQASFTLRGTDIFCSAISIEDYMGVNDCKQRCISDELCNFYAQSEGTCQTYRNCPTTLHYPSGNTTSLWKKSQECQHGYIWDVLTEHYHCQNQIQQEVSDLEWTAEKCQMECVQLLQCTGFAYKASEGLCEFSSTILTTDFSQSCDTQNDHLWKTYIMRTACVEDFTHFMQIEITTCDHEDSETSDPLTLKITNERGESFVEAVNPHSPDFTYRVSVIMIGEPVILNLEKASSENGVCLSDVIVDGVHLLTDSFWIDEPCNDTHYNDLECVEKSISFAIRQHQCFYEYNRDGCQGNVDYATRYDFSESLCFKFDDYHIYYTPLSACDDPECAYCTPWIDRNGDEAGLWDMYTCYPCDAHSSCSWKMIPCEERTDPPTTYSPSSSSPSASAPTFMPNILQRSCYACGACDRACLDACDGCSPTCHAPECCTSCPVNIFDTTSGPTTHTPTFCPSSTPTSSPSYFFEFNGDCDSAGDCVSSKNYPDPHGHREFCRVTMLNTAVVQLSAFFKLEWRYDDLKIGDADIEDEKDIPPVLWTGEICEWHTDASISYSGWQLCFSAPIASDFCSRDGVVDTWAWPGLSSAEACENWLHSANDYACDMCNAHEYWGWQLCRRACCMGCNGSVPNVTSTDPTSSPTTSPSKFPTSEPTSSPTTMPSTTPSSSPNSTPTTDPTTLPSSFPSSCPSSQPTICPTSNPISVPSSSPSTIPSSNPTTSTSTTPTSAPSSFQNSCPTGTGKTFLCNAELSNQEIARRACESEYGDDVGLCRVGRCGGFVYYYNTYHSHCSCSKLGNSYEFIFDNLGESYVGGDLGYDYDTSVAGNDLFVRRKVSFGCSYSRTWELTLANLGEARSTVTSTSGVVLLRQVNAPACCVTWGLQAHPNGNAWPIVSGTDISNSQCSGGQILTEQEWIDNFITLYLENKLGICLTDGFYIVQACPDECQCYTGHPWNGGQPVLEDGYCPHWCSRVYQEEFRFCGNGTAYEENGIDCRGCVATPSESSTLAPSGDFLYEAVYAGFCRKALNEQQCREFSSAANGLEAGEAILFNTLLSETTPPGCSQRSETVFEFNNNRNSDVLCDVQPCWCNESERSEVEDATQSISIISGGVNDFVFNITEWNLVFGTFSNSNAIQEVKQIRDGKVIWIGKIFAIIKEYGGIGSMYPPYINELSEDGKIVEYIADQWHANDILIPARDETLPDWDPGLQALRITAGVCSKDASLSDGDCFGKALDSSEYTCGGDDSDAQPCRSCRECSSGDFNPCCSSGSTFSTELMPSECVMYQNKLFRRISEVKDEACCSELYPCLCQPYCNTIHTNGRKLSVFPDWKDKPEREKFTVAGSVVTLTCTRGMSFPTGELQRAYSCLNSNWNDTDYATADCTVKTKCPEYIPSQAEMKVKVVGNAGYQAFEEYSMVEVERCDVGYEIHGDPLLAKCEYGEWVPTGNLSQCVPSQCDDLTVIANIASFRYVADPPFEIMEHNTEVFVESCEPGFVPKTNSAILRCDDGDWYTLFTEEPCAERQPCVDMCAYSCPNTCNEGTLCATEQCVNTDIEICCAEEASCTTLAISGIECTENTFINPEKTCTSDTCGFFDLANCCDEPMPCSMFESFTLRSCSDALRDLNPDPAAYCNGVTCDAARDVHICCIKQQSGPVPESGSLDLLVEVMGLNTDNMESICGSIATALEAQVVYCGHISAGGRRALQVSHLFMTINILEALYETTYDELKKDDFVSTLVNVPEGVTILSVQAAKDMCGFVPENCLEQIILAMTVRQYDPDHQGLYANFESIIGITIEQADYDDWTQYFFCNSIQAGDCNDLGLTAVCNDEGAPRGCSPDMNLQSSTQDPQPENCEWVGHAGYICASPSTNRFPICSNNQADNPYGYEHCDNKTCASWALSLGQLHYVFASGKSCYLCYHQANGFVFDADAFDEGYALYSHSCEEVMPTIESCHNGINLGKHISPYHSKIINTGTWRHSTMCNVTAHGFKEVFFIEVQKSFTITINVTWEGGDGSFHISYTSKCPKLHDFEEEGCSLRSGVSWSKSMKENSTVWIIVKDLSETSSSHVSISWEKTIQPLRIAPKKNEDKTSTNILDGLPYLLLGIICSSVVFCLCCISFTLCSDLDFDKQEQTNIVELIKSSRLADHRMDSDWTMRTPGDPSEGSLLTVGESYHQLSSEGSAVYAFPSYLSDPYSTPNSTFRHSGLPEAFSTMRLKNSRLPSIRDEECEPKRLGEISPEVSLKRDISTGASGYVTHSNTCLDYIIRHDELTYKEVVGQGSFGKVWRGLWQGGECAIKRCTSDTLGMIILEANVLHKVRRHPNILGFYGLCEDKGSEALILEYFAGGSVEKLYNSSEIYLTLEEKLHILQQAAAGVNHLHNNAPPIIHRDIACRNLLIDERHKVVVADFGLSRQDNYGTGDKTKTEFGPVRWMSPESIKDQKYSRASDVWAFACTAYELLEEKLPYYDLTTPNVVISVVQGEIPKENSTWSPDLLRLLKWCWAFEADNRPTMLNVNNCLLLLEGKEDHMLTPVSNGSPSALEFMLDEEEKQKSIAHSSKGHLPSVGVEEVYASHGIGLVVVNDMDEEISGEGLPDELDTSNEKTEYQNMSEETIG